MVDEWTRDGARVTDEGNIARLRQIIEDRAPVIVEHRFYRGSRAPHRFVCDDTAQLVAYLKDETIPGDAWWFWAVDDVCRDDNAVLSLMI